MNEPIDCERVRRLLMAAFDGEMPSAVSDSSPEPRLHLASCSSCGRWLRGLETMNSQFEGLSYPAARMDLWIAVEDNLRRSDAGRTVRRLWLIGALVLGWRSLELLVDLPFPMFHPFVPLAAALAALWLIAGDPLTIETTAPELQEGRV